ncbi:MAG: DUF4178 domain-containing protein [Desulfobacteraceae bacterium]|nr:DUF4178 domain-containing protein [Desulfobacteraceae bacterium]
MDSARFKSREGRSRPPYQPKTIRCEACGASLTVKDEHSEMVVCEYCGSRLDVSATEQKVLGKKQARTVNFAIHIGDSFYHKSCRFEVIGRLAYIEDGNVMEMTKEYLLYNPRHGSMWLGQYQGSYSLTKPCHVMPYGNPLKSARGKVIKTYDNKKWVSEGSGEYELYYVDGALPWVAQVGDRVEYAEFVHDSGSGRLYEAQKSNQELEYGMGWRLSPQTVARALRKPEFEQTAKDNTGADTAINKKWYKQLMLLALLGLLINGLAALYCAGRGELVLQQRLNAAELDQGAYTNRFPIRGGTAVKIKLNAPLNNAWMQAITSIVREDDKMVHDIQTSMEYYYGAQSGESWSEGSRKRSFIVLIPQAGNYRLFVRAVSAKGNTTRAKHALHSLSVKIYDGALPWKMLAFVAGVCAFLLIVTFISYSKWAGIIEFD